VNYSANNNFYNLAAGTYKVYVKDGQGCILDTAIVVTQPYPVTVAITPQDSLITLGATIQLFTVLNNPTAETINSYAWTPAAGLSCLDCPYPFSSPYQNIQYYLTVNYGKNCTTTATNTIEVQRAGVYIPNAFTPNGDGINDVFEVFGTTLYSVSMKVFNRWGEKVFDSEDNQWATWDGTYKGVKQPPGVYVYYVTLVFLDGTTSTREGSVTLIR
jgi:gliding motility-associated-like protein